MRTVPYFGFFSHISFLHALTIIGKITDISIHGLQGSNPIEDLALREWCQLDRYRADRSGSILPRVPLPHRVISCDVRPILGR